MIDMLGRKEASKGIFRETGPRQQFQVTIRTLKCLKRDIESRDPSNQLSQAERKAEKPPPASEAGSKICIKRLLGSYEVMVS